MPDYNPAVAAGIQPPQNNFVSTLGTAAGIQAEQARSNLYTLQGLQQQREYGALQAAAQAGAQGQPRAEAYMRAGGQNPGLISGFQQYDSNQSFAASHGGNLPPAAEASANIALRGAETRKANLEAAKLGPEIDQGQKDDAARAATSYLVSGDPTLMFQHAARYADKDNVLGIQNLINVYKTNPDRFKQIAQASVGGGPKGGEIVQAETPQGAKSYTPFPNFIGGGGATGPTIAQAEAAKTQAAVPAELDKELQDRTQGAVEAIQRLTRLKNAVKNSDPLNFGSMLGSETARQFNPSPALAAEHDNLQSLYRDAGSAMLKSRFGARVTNMDVTQGLKIVGGTTVQNKQTALKILDNNTAEAYDAIANGIQRGIINPSEVLARPASKAEADSLGTGALWINSKGEIKRNPR